MNRLVSWAMVITLLVNVLALPFLVRPANATGTIYINADGSISPQPTPIQSADNITYIFTNDIMNSSIIVQRNNTLIDGKGHMLQGQGIGIGTGLDLSYTENVTVQNTTITAFNYGMLLSLSSHDSVRANIVANCSIGIYAQSSLNSTFCGNSISLNNQFGLQLLSSSGNVISANNVTNNGGGSGYGISLGWSGSNRNNITDNELKDNNYGGIGVYWSSDFNLVARNSVVGGSQGIDLSNTSSNCTIVDNNVTGCGTSGIRLYGYNSNNTIARNRIIACGWYGLDVFSESNNNEITQNVIEAERYAGMRLGGTLNDVFANEVSTGQGIGNGAYGIVIYASGNFVYHNNFLWNSPHTYNPYACNSTWDDGYPSGGNYWSGYPAVDQKNGPYQNETGSDGIGDSPYIVDPNNLDHYPLTAPWPSNDVALLNLTTSKLGCKPTPTVGENCSVLINATVGNLGSYAEGFDVVVYANGTEVARGNMGLASRCHAVMNFNLSTVGWAKGNYTIRAYAEPIQGEANTTNNLLEDWFVVTLLGDVNGDGKVDVKDVYATALAFGTSLDGPNPEGRRYNPNCDINDDYMVDVKDYYIVCRHYGEVDP